MRDLNQGLVIIIKQKNMNILTENQQLEIRLNEIDDAIVFIGRERKAIAEKIERKDNFGIFAFVSESYSILYSKLKNKDKQLDVLRDYRAIIADRLSA